MTMEIAEKSVDMFVMLARGGKSIEFIFTGGEPLIALDLLDSITHYARRQTLDAGMTPSFVLKTNGTLLKGPALDYVKRNGVGVVVSIDGLPEVHDAHRVGKTGKKTHSATIKNIQRALAAGVNCSASLTVHPDGVKRVLDAVHYLHAMGIGWVNIGPVYGTVHWSVDQVVNLSASLLDVARFIRAVHKEGGALEVGPIYRESEHIGGKLSNIWGCHAASTNLAFLPDGKISGCSSLGMLSTQFSDLCLGNVFSGLDSDSVDRMLSIAQADISCRPACRNCATAENCAGGCLAFNYAINDAPFEVPCVYCNTIATILPAWNLAWGEDAVTAGGSKL